MAGSVPVCGPDTMDLIAFRFDNVPGDCQEPRSI